MSFLQSPTQVQALLQIIYLGKYAYTLPDILVDHFLDNTNYQYYALYPPAFMQDYNAWWSGRATGLQPTPEFTCLLLRLCACSISSLDEDIRQKLESELGQPVDSLSTLYHNTAKQLSGTIGPGKGGLMQVQQLFLTAQWFKTEALFVESWHALSAAIHEAQEQGIYCFSFAPFTLYTGANTLYRKGLHRSSSGPRFSDFDREMRRRLWFILYAWDWYGSHSFIRLF